MRRVSGPLLDRIDLRVVMPRMEAEQLVETAAPEPSSVVAGRIAKAWQLARERNGGIANARLGGAQLMKACALDDEARVAVKELSAGLDLTARGVHRMLRVARTISDLAGRGPVDGDAVLAASSLRDRSLEVEMAA